MQSRKKIVAVVGSYRKGGTIDTVVDEILASAAEQDAVVQKIYLRDRHIDYCRNCRHCTQLQGELRGACVLDDDMEALLLELDAADAIVLGAPINFFTVTALTKCFVERLVCCAYWPWGARVPALRRKQGTRKAALVVSCAMPALLARFFCNGHKVLKSAALAMGARSVGLLVVGQAALRERQELPRRARKAARRLGRRLGEG